MERLAERTRFEVVESEELQKQIYRLRYAVYVRECGFEKEADHHTDRETDPYDPHSVHIAAIEQVENRSDTVIGTIRLVLNSPLGFPIEHATPTHFIGEKPPPDRIAEISRLTVTKDYRRRQGDGLHGVESYLKVSEGGILPDDTSVPADCNRIRPFLVLGLYKKMYHESKRLGITHWYMITEKKLWYALRRYGFIFHQIGEPVEYHGLRIPYLGIIEEIEHNLINNHLDFFYECLNGMPQDLWPAQLR